MRILYELVTVSREQPQNVTGGPAGKAAGAEICKSGDLPVVVRKPEKEDAHRARKDNPVSSHEKLTVCMWGTG